MTKRKNPPTPPLAEVITLHEPDAVLIHMLEELLDLAEQGRLTSMVGYVTVDNQDEILVCGRPENPAKTIGDMEIVKAELITELMQYHAETQ